MPAPKTPSKYTSRSFLEELQENHYISKSGVEYCAPEVDELLTEKETESPIPEHPRGPDAWTQAQINALNDFRDIYPRGDNDTNNKRFVGLLKRKSLYYVAKIHHGLKIRGENFTNYLCFVVRALRYGPSLLLDETRP